MDLPLQRVEEFLHQRIPLAKAFNCQIVESNHKTLSLRAPKFANTVSDGEFSDLATLSVCKLAAWTFLQVALQRLDFKPLIQLETAAWKRSRIVDTKSDFITATSTLPGEKEWQQFLRMLSRKGRAVVSLESKLSDELGDSATLTCEYLTRDLDQA